MRTAPHQGCGKAREISLTFSLSARSSLGLQSPGMCHTEADLPTFNRAATWVLLRAPFAGAAHGPRASAIALLSLGSVCVLWVSLLIFGAVSKNYQVVSVNPSSLPISSFFSPPFFLKFIAIPLSNSDGSNDNDSKNHIISCLLIVRSCPNSRTFTPSYKWAPEALWSK